jgi:hypothetical protein
VREDGYSWTQGKIPSVPKWDNTEVRWGHGLILDHGPEVTDREGEEEDHGDEITDGLSSQGRAILCDQGRAGGLNTVPGVSSQ